MAKNTGKPVTVQLDKERHLRMTLGAMLAYEKQTGKSLLQGFDLAKMSLEDISALFWACLLHEDRTLTFDQFVWELADLSDIQQMSIDIARCINESVPEEQGPLAGSPQDG